MPSVTQAVEDYLKAIWRLSHDGGEQVSVGDIAAELRVSAPSVTSMVGKLKAMHLLRHAPYSRVTLTARGGVIIPPGSVPQGVLDKLDLYARRRA